MHVCIIEYLPTTPFSLQIAIHFIIIVYEDVFLCETVEANRGRECAKMTS